MSFKKIILKIFGYAILILIISLIITSSINARKSIKVGDINNYIAKTDSEFIAEGSYKKYLNNNIDQNIYPVNGKNIEVDLKNPILTQSTSSSYKWGEYAFFDYENNEETSIEGLYTADFGSISFNFNIPDDKSGLYNLFIEYVPLVDNPDAKFRSKTGEVQRILKINDEIPFNEAGQIKLTRKWKNVGILNYEKDKLNNNIRPVFSLNDKGDEIRPNQEEITTRIKTFIGDFDNFNIDPYFFYLKGGENKITIEATREPLFISKLVFKNAPKILSYEEYLEKNKDIKLYSDDNIKIEAEAVYLKSSPVLVPLVDLVSPKAYPNFSGKEVKLNTIGKYSWRMPGYWVSYKINVPYEAMYEISLIGKQDIKAGGFSGREILINGEIPFKEASYIPLHNSVDMTCYEIKNKDTPYLFKLNKGENIITFKVSNGNFSEILQMVSDVVDKLNNLYLDVIKITKTQNDPNITYNLASKIPALEDIIQLEIRRLENIVSEYHRISNNNTGRTSVLRNIIIQLKRFNKDPDKMAGEHASFKSNIAAMGTWILTETEQPFTMDAIILHKNGADVERSRPNFFESFWHEFKKFIYSFTSHNRFTGGKGREKVKVWMSAGRDNVQILKRLMDNDFAKKHPDIGVELELVPPEVLLRAIVSGKAPDVAINVPEGTPIDFAFRDATYDLTNFPDFSSYAKKYNESAITPFRFEGGIYALPEQQMFPVLFYRTDIFDKYNLKPPQNYEELDYVIRELQGENLNFYIESGASSLAAVGLLTANTVNSGLFGTILYQMGGKFYNDKGDKTALDSKVASEAFLKFTKYFTEGGLDVVANFLNRFRSGEIAAGITGYGLYNQLAVFAPEIAGKWKIAQVPSFLTKSEMLNSKGTSHNILSNIGLASIILKSSKNKEISWKFLKWWLSDQVQLQYGRDLEITIGAAARYTSASKNVLSKLAWPSQDLDVILKSFDETVGVPQVPGGYMTTRQYTYAFLTTVEDNKNPYEMLSQYVKDINPELTKKRKEFEIK